MIKKVAIYTILSIIAIIPSLINTDKWDSFDKRILNIACVLPLILFGIYEIIKNHKQECRQNLFNRWSIFLHTTNIQQEDNLRPKNDNNFKPYRELLSKFTLEELKELKKNNYFHLKFNIEHYETVVSILNIFCAFIDKIDFKAAAMHTETLLLDSPKEVKP